MAINDNTSYELFGYQVKDLATKIKSKAEASSLAPVATSGLYSDLTGKPTIPTVYNGTLTIQQNGTTVDTFTANSSTNKTVNIETITADTVAPAQQVGAVTTNMIADEAVTAAKMDFGTLVKSGTWTNTTSLPSTASSAYTTIDVSSLGFSSADDYIVVATNMGGANNDPFLTITIPSTNKTATSFTLMIWNAHWASGAIGSGTKIQWAVFRVN